MYLTLIFLLGFIIALGVAFWQKKIKNKLIVAALGIMLIMLMYFAFTYRISQKMP